MAKSLLFTCGFNRGRSIASEYLFRHMLQQRNHELAQQVKVSSAGLISREDIDWLKRHNLPIPRPVFGKAPYQTMVAILLERGIDTSGHRSRVLTRTMVEEADLIIISGEEHPPYRKRTICSFWPFARDKVFTFREFIEAEEVEGEYLATEDPTAVPYTDKVFLDYTREYWEGCLAEIEGYLAQKMDKLLSYLGIPE